MRILVYYFLHLTKGCSHGDVRIASETNQTEGRVEICLNNEWGTICDQMWDNMDTMVVCRQLHLHYTEAVALSSAEVNPGSGRIWLGGIQCTGNETRLSDCPFIAATVNTCTHAQDAGARCPPGMYDA